MDLADSSKAWIRAGIWLAAFLLACGVFIAVQSRPLFVSVLGIFAVVGAARRLHDVVGRQLTTEGLTRRNRILWLATLPLAGFVLLVIWRVGRGDGWGFFGVSLLFLGIGLIVDRLRQDIPWSEKWGPRILAGSAVGVLAGLLGMAIFGLRWAWLVVVVALVFVPVGLSLVSAVCLRRFPETRRLHWMVPIIGLVLFGGGLLAVALDVNDTYVLVFGAAVFAVMLAIAARSNADILLVVAMAGLVWALNHRSAPLTDSVAAASDTRAVVALGDSYISGEGAEEFYEGTNAKGDNECRRSPTAYPVALVEEEHQAIPEDLHLVFLACSGAKASGLRDQLTEFEDLQEEIDFDVEFVLLSVGGNEALFGSVARTCLLPGDCSELGPAWLDNLHQVRGTIDDLYEDVGETFDRVPVLVVPYPVPISEQHCSSSGFTRDEHQFLHDFTIALNDVLRVAAADAGFHYVDTMPGALAQADARLCDGPPSEVGVNFLAANSVVGTLEQASYPLNWFHNSLHPNAVGHNLMRGSIIQWLDRNAPLDVRTAASPDDGGDDASDDADEIAARRSRCQGTSGDDLAACTDEWMIEQSGRLLLVEGWVAVAIALGAWLVVLPLIHLWRLLFDR